MFSTREIFDNQLPHDPQNRCGSPGEQWEILDGRGQRVGIAYTQELAEAIESVCVED